MSSAISSLPSDIVSLDSLRRRRNCYISEAYRETPDDAGRTDDSDDAFLNVPFDTADELSPSPSISTREYQGSNFGPSGPSEELITLSRCYESAHM